MKPREPMVMRVLMLMEYRMLEPAPIMRLLTMALTASTSLYRSYPGLGQMPYASLSYEF